MLFSGMKPLSTCVRWSVRGKSSLLMGLMNSFVHPTSELVNLLKDASASFIPSCNVCNMMVIIFKLVN